MTQETYIRNESRKHGIKRTIKVPTIAANGTKQYDRTHDKLKSGVGVFGSYNAITVMNNDVVDIELALDFAEEKTYPIPAGSSITIDEIEYLGFNVTEISGTGVTDGKVTVMAIYEPPVLREKFTSYKMRGGK